MLSAYFRIYSVSSTQPPDASPKVSQRHGLPPEYPESSVPGKLGRHCFLLPSLLIWVTHVPLMWILSLPGQTSPGEGSRSPGTCGCAQWSSLSCSRNVYGEPPSSARNFAEA